MTSSAAQLSVIKQINTFLDEKDTNLTNLTPLNCQKAEEKVLTNNSNCTNYS